MNIVKKLAALAAVAALSAPAFAADPDLATYDTAANTATAMQAQITAAATLNADGNFALIFQEASASNAYIEQTGATNFAAIIQSTNDASTGVVIQVGDGNRAMIYQH